MKLKVLLTSSLVLIGLLTALLIPVSAVMAVGAPSDNMTIPGFIDDDQAQDEIPVPVNYIRYGPSAQSDNTTAGIIPAFISSSGEKDLIITADETWYLDIDINVDGWVYIYEYYPEGAGIRGRWIAYKLQLP